MTILEFKEHLLDFTRHLRSAKQMSIHTILAYQRDLQQIVRYWERIPTAESSCLAARQIIERYFFSLHTQKITRSSIARKVSCMQTFAAFLKAKNIDLQLNIQRPRFDENMPAPLSFNDITYALEHCAECQSASPLRDRAIFALLYETGIHCSELIKLSISDLNAQTHSVRITGSGKKMRTLPYSALTFSWIEEYIRVERSMIKSDRTILFLNHVGGALTCRSIQRIIAAFREIIPHKPCITPRTLRISRAKHLLSQGVEVAVIQDFLGHNTRNSTERYTRTHDAQKNYQKRHEDAA